MDNYYLFHYYLDAERSHDTLTMEELTSAKEYADYVHVKSKSGALMPNYSERYFERRLQSEQTCKDILEKKYGPVSRKTPLYATLGKEDATFFKGKHHKFSWAVPISLLDPKQLLFVIGDSVGNSAVIESHCFTYDEFKELTMNQVLTKLPSLSDDRYIEVQIWDEQIDKLLDHREQVSYYGGPVRFPSCSVGRYLKDKIWELKERGEFEVFVDGLRTARLDFIPKGRVHGIPHSIRCAFLAFCIACENGLSLEDSILTAKYAGYHDCGRSLERREEKHAEASRLAIRELFDEREWDLAYAVISHHNRSKEEIACLPETKNEKPLQLMAKIVHDVDSLDYIRFLNEDGMDVFSAEYLILDVSKKYVLSAYELYWKSMEDYRWIETIFQ